jgi:anti-sigma B factor antagonist
MSLEVSIKRIGADTAVVTLTGALALGTQLKIADTQLQNLVEGGISKLVLDLTAVPYSDSAGLGMLIHIYGMLREKQGSVRLCGLSGRVASLLRLTHTDTLLPVDPDVDASLSTFE